MIYSFVKNEYILSFFSFSIKLLDSSARPNDLQHECKFIAKFRQLTRISQLILNRNIEIKTADPSPFSWSSTDSSQFNSQTIIIRNELLRPVVGNSIVYRSHLCSLSHTHTHTFKLRKSIKQAYQAIVWKRIERRTVALDEGGGRKRKRRVVSRKLIDDWHPWLARKNFVYKNTVIWETRGNAHVERYRYSAGFSSSRISTIYNYKRARAEVSIAARHPRRRRIDRVLSACKRHHVTRIHPQFTQGYIRLLSW